jgi:hypothetical protein
MIKRVFTIGVAVALGLASLLSVPAIVSAKGFGLHRSHFGPSFFAKSALLHHRHGLRHRRSDDLLASYGYVMPDASLEPDIDGLPSLRMIALSPIVRCQHSRQTVTVPSEDGGTREITITRC